MKQTFNLEVPFFPGFYDSIIEPCDFETDVENEEIRHLQIDLKIKMEDEELRSMLIWDYSSRRKAIASEFLSQFEDCSPAWVLSAKNDELVSPKEYNFKTDRLFADVELDDNWETEMRKFMFAHNRWLKKQIWEDWYSRDGFMSFMSSRFSDWYEKIFKEYDERYISTMIGYIMYKADNDVRYSMSNACTETIWDGEFLSYSPELQEKVDFAYKCIEVDKLQLSFNF